MTVGSVHPVRPAIYAPVSPAAPPTRGPPPPAPAPAAPARHGPHQAPSGHARDWACAIVPRFRGNIKGDTRQTTSFNPPRSAPLGLRVGRIRLQAAADRPPPRPGVAAPRP